MTANELPVPAEFPADPAATGAPGWPAAANAGRPTRRHVLLGAALVGVGAATGGSLLDGCSSSSGSGTPNDARHQTLFLAGEQWGPVTNFNPLSPTAAFPCQFDQMQFIYEALFGYDILDGSLKPHLAQSLDMPDQHTIVVKLQPAAKWQDGQALTADDVVYTFELAKRHTEAPYAYFWQYVSAVTKTDDHTVTFALNPKQANPGITKANLAQVSILPAHLWQGYETQNAKLVEFTNLQPVGSGPYKVDSYNATQVKYVRDDNYWGKAVRGKVPAPKWLVHPIFKDNAAGDLAFERGEVDVSQQFTPQVWKMWQDKKEPIGTWYDKPPYHVPGSIPMLVLNTTKKGLNNPLVRRAFAHAIDYARIAQTAMSQYSDPAQSSIVIPKGAEQQYFDAANVAANGWTYNPDKAKQLLAQAGATKGGDGIYKLADGTRLGGFSLQTPTGWSDWQTALQIVVENLKTIGVDVTAQYPQAQQVTTAVQNGNFDLAIWYVAGNSPAAPWQRFRDVLDNRGVPAVGQSAFYNYGRFSDSRVAALLDQAATASAGQAKQLFSQLDTIFMQNAPMIPLMYRPLDFYEYNESVWVGFPNSANPSAPPMWRGDGVAWLFDLKLKSA
jgi:peptide/nickel transport system substrate-binding protein